MSNEEQLDEEISMAREIADELAQFTVGTRYEDIPAEVMQFTKFLLMKTVGGMVAGQTHPSARKIAGLMQRRKGPDEATVIRSGFKTGLLDAAFLNAYFAHARELEDDRFGGGVAWDITVIPLLVPLAEKMGLSGRALLEAIAVGLEVHTRTCLFSAEHIGLTIVPGAVGPAAGAARALGLTAQQTAMAMGAALSSANLSLTNFGTDAHYLESSLHTLHGLLAAETAQMDMTSNPDIGSFASRLLGQGVRPDDMVKDLGKHWHLTEIMIKKYSCCFILHRQIDSVLELRKKHGLADDDVASIEVHGSPADELCNRPNPKTEGDLQFSFQHVLSAAMLDGDLGLEHFDTAIIEKDRYTKARAKVKFSVDPNLSKVIMVAPSRVSITTRDGRVLTAERQYPIGSLPDPLSPAGLRAVYSKFAKGLLTDKVIERSADFILDLENKSDIRELMAMIQ